MQFHDTIETLKNALLRWGLKFFLVICVVATVLAIVLAAGQLANGDERSPEWVILEELQEEFDLTDEALPHIMQVHEETGQPLEILTSIVDRESYGGEQYATRFCMDWSTKETEDGKVKKTCPKQASCPTAWKTGCIYRGKKHPEYTGKFFPPKHVRKNGLDVGPFQLRHSPTWSWIRFYNKRYGTRHRKSCAVDWECATKVMIFAVNYLSNERGDKGCKRPEHIRKLQWVGHWNGCGSYRKHIRRYLKLREAPLVAR